MDLKKIKEDVFKANLELVNRGLVIYTWGKDADSAVEHSVILEELAKMAKYSVDIAGGDIFLPEYMTEKHYTRKYGKDAYFYQSKED